jgi:hypothetical protein
MEEEYVADAGGRVRGHPDLCHLDQGCCRSCNLIDRLSLILHLVGSRVELRLTAEDELVYV